MIFAYRFNDKNDEIIDVAKIRKSLILSISYSTLNPGKTNKQEINKTMNPRLLPFIDLAKVLKF